MNRSRIAAFVLLAAGLVAVWRWPAPPPAVCTVTADGRPVAGATVRYQGAALATHTDACGRFDLRAVGKAPARITAARSGYAIAFTNVADRPWRLELVPLPAADNDDYQWLDPTPDPGRPANCGNCHAAIHREWSQSAHARSATNPRVHAVFAAVHRDRPDDTGVCAKCHAPTMRDPAIEYDLRTVTGIDVHGVHCDYCHKVVDAPTDKLGTRFGNDGLRLLRPPNGQMLFFGPLDDAVREGEQFGHAPVYKESRYCASCHEGVIYGVHVYGTYSEWLESPARKKGQQCQTCHMAPTGKLTNLAPGHGGIERDPATLASHTTLGGTREMLKRCLSVKAAISGQRVDVEVRADNVGHRVPTGFPERQLVLIVEDGQQSFRKVYARTFKDEKGRPVRFWQALDDPEDTRLFPGKADRVQFTFERPVTRVRVRLVYRRLGYEQPGEELVVVDTSFTAGPAR
jgi:hypothetical protein